jgi:hypothetical protein
MGHSGQFGYVAVAVEMTPERAGQVLAEIKKGLPPRVLDFGHESLKTKAGEPYTQFSFLSTKANQPKITDEIAGIAERVSTILARDGHEVVLDPNLFAVTRSQPLLRERPPQTAESRTLVTPVQAGANGARAPRAPTPTYAAAQAQATGAPDMAVEL